MSAVHPYAHANGFIIFMHLNIIFNLKKKEILTKQASPFLLEVGVF